MDASLPFLIALLTAAPFIIAYWVGRAVVRVRLGRWLREGRTWRTPALAPVEEEWLVPGWDPARLPAVLSLVEVACEWATVDPLILRDLRFLKPDRGRDAPLERLLRSLWEGIG